MVYFVKFLSPDLCRYWKGQYAHILNMLFYLRLKNGRKTLDNKGYIGAILIDFSKTFDSINHKLLISKSYAYEFSKDSFILIHSSVPHRWQKNK